MKELQQFIMLFKYLSRMFPISLWYISVHSFMIYMHGSQLTVSSRHGLQFTPNLRLKRRVATLGDPWSVPQPPGNLFPANGYTTHSKPVASLLARFVTDCTRDGGGGVRPIFVPRSSTGAVSDYHIIICYDIL